ncbi:bifunctional 4-hydroxy-2-oxoglutarate aldolase/2-dehydro-3-deoxy-phosphogluconate aldolase (plasmid) [Deinococcus radiomollis]|uniref:bifunctional 4-hydroxy-2-oxoglutarate aldolase/2-dehydro-3-deoxy-phosphogluconate aldolase n=1 Tax=Deinococcus radiomollis TaxID=468916 RepID=UPI003892A93A
MLELVVKHKIVAILRGVPVRHAPRLAEHLYRAGIRLLEVSLSDEHGLPGLRAIREAFGADLHVGAGTVVTLERARQAQDAGASFLLTPHLVPPVHAFAREQGLGLIAGATTPTELQQALSEGSSVVKLFPAGDLGLGYLTSLFGPYPDLPLLVVGGIDQQNLGAFLQAGALGAGIGSYLTKTDWNSPDFALLETRARDLLEIAERGSQSR